MIRAWTGRKVDSVSKLACLENQRSMKSLRSDYTLVSAMLYLCTGMPLLTGPVDRNACNPWHAYTCTNMCIHMSTYNHRVKRCYQHPHVWVKKTGMKRVSHFPRLMLQPVRMTLWTRPSGHRFPLLTTAEVRRALPQRTEGKQRRQTHSQDCA